MSLSLPNAVDVVIVGAGPAGLVCAISLASRGIPFVLVDALSGGLKGSRAVVMHANALEVLKSIDRELAQEMVKAGVQSKTVDSVDEFERPIFSVNMGANAQYTEFPYVLLVGQNEVERILLSYLKQSGHDVIWNERVTGLEEGLTDDGPFCKVAFQSGKHLSARYVVASDGCRSTIRAAAGIRYIDTTSNEDSMPSSRDAPFIVADVLFSDPLPASIPRDTFRLLVHPDGPVVTAPLINPDASESEPDQHLFRLYIGVQGTPPSVPDATYVQAILDARGPGVHDPPHEAPRVARVLLSSRSRSRFALAERFVKRTRGGAHVILVGDAAHRHGPSGGLGMNLAICDGRAAARAIDEHREAVGRGDAYARCCEVFDTYAARRRKIAARVVALVEQLHNLEMGGAGWTQWARIHAVRALLRIPFVNRTAAWMLSGLVHVWKAV